MAYNDYEAVIGLEIHAQLLTQSKIFSSASTEFGGGDNDHVTPVCAGMPGTLPVLNKKAVELAVKTGIALNSQINTKSVFARKQYFYPDLPKGYQISQFDQPICIGGYVEFYVGETLTKVRLERAHMEEDAGKSTHHGDYTLVNLNRAGIPLMEIVSAPDMRSPAEAAEYSKAVRQILRYIGVCDGNLEEGSLRCDCNVSVRKRGAKELGTKVELKNINSFKFIEKAIEYEIQRQIDTIEGGEKIFQETRLYDSARNKTFSMRSKEEAQDYRYFPDPDLLPIQLDSSWIETLRQQLPELPLAKAQRFQNTYGLPAHDAQVLTQEKEMSAYFENTVHLCGNAKAVANWIMAELLRELNENKVSIDKSPISSQGLAQLVSLIDQGTISGKMAKQVFVEMWARGEMPKMLVEKMGLSQVTDTTAIEKMVSDVLAANPEQVAQFKMGKEKVFGFFVGQVMKVSKGQANPDAVNRILKEALSK